MGEYEGYMMDHIQHHFQTRDFAQTKEPIIELSQQGRIPPRGLGVTIHLRAKRTEKEDIISL